MNPDDDRVDDPTSRGLDVAMARCMTEGSKTVETTYDANDHSESDETTSARSIIPRIFESI
jgi:hypothetical protein